MNNRYEAQQLRNSMYIRANRYTYTQDWYNMYSLFVDDEVHEHTYMNIYCNNLVNVQYCIIKQRTGEWLVVVGLVIHTQENVKSFMSSLDILLHKFYTVYNTILRNEPFATSNICLSKLT